MSYDHHAELSAVCCALVRPESVALMNLSVDDFMDGRLGRLYGAASTIAKAGEEPDVITVARECGESVAWVSEVIDAGLTANPEAYAKQIRVGGVRRSAAEIADRIAKGGDPAQEVPNLLAMLQPSRGQTVGLAGALKSALASLEQGPQGAPWGYSRLDSRLGPMGNGHLIVIGGRPAMGKTAFALNVALRTKGRVLFVSGEQPAEQIALRALSITSQVPHDVIKSRRYGDEVPSKLTAATQDLKHRGLEIADFDSPTLGDVFAVARKEHFREPVSAIVVDYLQRMRVAGKAQNRSYEVGDNAQGLKTLARQLDVPVIVLAQVNREVENRPDKRPHMADLKDSGVIEQEADLVGFLYRDEHYNEQTRDKGVCEFLIDKNRHGPTGRVRLAFNNACMRFDDLEERR